MNELFYAREGDQTYVRFSRRENRDFWVSKAENRSAVRSNDRGLKAFLAKSPTWEYVEGVSWGNLP